MEEEVGIKVTRLRRRLSVEADDVKSPSTQSTPTKKRGGRLAAKPQLELIAENAPEAAPKRTRKSTVKEIAEPVEEKTVTPSRRSTRIKSNTSIVSETPGDVAEEKGTPSRRTTRIKSNTSLIAEPVNVNSPRAKRAARRTSQVGSDNEGPITPARTTRRTRNNSTSSIDKPVEPIAGKLGGDIKEVIVEESENNVNDNKTTERSKNDSPSLRKSPRLVGKSGRKSSSLDNDNKENEPGSEKEASETPAAAEKSLSEPKPDTTEVADQKVSEQINLSVTSKNLIQEIEEVPKKAKSIFNKSATAVEEEQIKTKRNRTKSWTTISVESPQESSFCSDSEANKKRNKKKNDTLNFSNISGSGDGIMNVNSKNDEADKEQDDVSLNSSTLSNKKKKKRHEKSTTVEMETSQHEVSLLNTSVNKSAAKLTVAKDASEDVNEEGKIMNSSKKLDTTGTQKLFEQAPSGIVQSLVFIEDSDSNQGKENNDKKSDSGDQCVPVVDQQLVDGETKNLKSNLSYEPMDIDETMPENVSLSHFVDKNDSASEKRKSMLNLSQVKNDSINKSKLKSGIPDSALENNIDEASTKSPRKSSITEMINDLDSNKSKRKSSIPNEVSEDTTDGIFNVSSRKSIVVDTDNHDESINKKANKSKRKSSIFNVTEQNMDEDSNNSARKFLNADNKSFDEIMNTKVNTSKRKSSISNVVTEQNMDDDSNNSARKSLNTDNKSFDEIMNKKTNKSKRRSSILNGLTEQNMDEDSNNSDRKSLNTDNKSFDEIMNKKANKSKRRSSISNVVTERNMDEDSNNSARKSLHADNKSFDEIMNKESNKSKRKSSLSHVIPVENKNESSNKSTRKSSVSDLANEDNIEKSLNQSKRKSVTTMVVEISTDKINTSILADDEDMENKSSNKSKRKSSISNTNNDSMDKNDKSKNKSALYLDKTENNENKSTLVLSQLKDVPEDEINAESNAAKDSKDSNEQLSKSVNVPNVNTEKDTDRKNLSLTYSTSTPLQQKSMKKLGLQINSSIIAPNSANKIEKKDTVNKSKKEPSIMSEEGSSDSSEEEEDLDEDVEEDSEEESSMKKSKLIEDEAEEASDDYESGDSRDEEEREYEEGNEIKEKGETLDSDEAEFSDDSDYEKDSFIVSSDEEDKYLLSGSGDDLSMSADELTMTASSKKKFNERKIKEQKKASREMYEARHKLNESDKSERSPKSKKNNRQRFDTSSSEEDGEVAAQPRKNRRQRINSSHDANALQSDTDKSVSKKQKSRRLSESVCDEDETNEKEITIRDENQADKIDPLILLNVIKEEPKTPQKGLNISTVAVTNMDEVEEVNIDENVSIMKANQTSDPLQATIAENDEEDITDEGSISENEEITQNYESILSNLNRSISKKIKSSNISLDLNKKTKKAKEPIVEQLNLTQVKKSKKSKANATENAAETKKQDKSLNKSTEKVGEQDTLSEASSDSIDMKLLFPEDSNDSEVVIENKKQGVKETMQNEDGEESPGDFIPLKRSLGKTNILENMNIVNKSEDESILNISSKKKNKRKSFQSQETLEMGTPEDDNLGFFIDTTGSLADENKADANTSIKNSAKKNKQKNNASFSGRQEIPLDEDSNDAPLEVSYRSEKNKSKQDLNTTQNNARTQEVSATVGTPNQSAKKKMKNKKGLNSSQNVAEISVIETTDDIPEKSINTSVTNVEGSTKKKKKRLSESQIAQETENGTPTEHILNVSIGSAKKQKQKTISESTAVETKNVNKGNEDVMNQELVTKKRKRKSSANQTIEEIIIKDDVKLTNDESITTKNQKKKRKISNNEDIKTQVEDAVTETQEHENKPVENNKKKNKVQHQKANEIDEGATKKNKKRKERDDDDASKMSKVLKQNSFDKIHVPRLPSNILKQLDDKPKTDVVDAKKTKVVSTSEFVVEETKRRRTKPSNYLEESVYCINDDMDTKTQKRSIKNPKVLPFIPTASTSDSGFTTNFRVNVISQQTKFVAQSSDVSNFKNDYLLKKRIKKLGTFEMYKRQRNIKIAKF